MKAPLPANEATRLNTLQEYQILDTLPEQTYDDLTRLTAIICGAPVALMTLIDADRQWLKAHVGFDAQEMPREIAFCAHAILHTDVTHIPDLRTDARFSDNPLVTGGPQARFYAGAPLVTADGSAIGTLCVIDNKPRELSPQQVEALEILARQIVVSLELRRTLQDMVQIVAMFDPADVSGNP